VRWCGVSPFKAGGEAIVAWVFNVAGESRMHRFYLKQKNLSRVAIAGMRHRVIIIGTPRMSSALGIAESFGYAAFRKN
jgi:hypothetical protein